MLLEAQRHVAKKLRQGRAIALWHQELLLTWRQSAWAPASCYLC
jgi:hypothetical protein